jgi:hypothetical protein
MLDGITTISLCRMLAGTSTLGQSMPSRECAMRLFVGNLMRGLLRTTTPDVNTLGLEESDKDLLPQFVQTAKQNVSPSPFQVVCLGNLQMIGCSSPAVCWRLGRFTILLLGRCHCGESYCLCAGSHDGCRAVRAGWS